MNKTHKQKVLFICVTYRGGVDLKSQNVIGVCCVYVTTNVESCFVAQNVARSHVREVGGKILGAHR